MGKFTSPSFAVSSRDEGNIRAAIACHPTHRKRMAVHDDDDGRPAHTGYRVIERLNQPRSSKRIGTRVAMHRSAFTFNTSASPSPETTPTATQTKKLAELTHYEAPRVLLHAHKLAFTHPRTGKKVSFTARYLPTWKRR